MATPLHNAAPRPATTRRDGRRRTPRWPALLWMLTALGRGWAAEPPRLALDLLTTELGWTSRVVQAECIMVGDGTNRAALYPGQRRIELNGFSLWLHYPVMPCGASNATVTVADANAILRPLLCPAPPTNLVRTTLPRVMLDPGHGGEDGGATTPDGLMLEKSFTLDLAQRIKRRLLSRGYPVACTRDDDRFLSLDERSEEAESWQADIFVSLHANYAANSAAMGRETYVLPVAGAPPTAAANQWSARLYRGNSNDVRNTKLGFAIHRNLPGRLRSADRGLRRARFQVLRKAPCAAVLVEFGFFSNGRDARLLGSDWYRNRLADAIVKGIEDYVATLPIEPPPQDDIVVP